jgi:hypothetical protein
MSYIESLEARRLCSGVWALPTAEAHVFLRNAAEHLAAVKGESPAPNPVKYDGAWNGSYRVTDSSLDPNVTVLIDTQTPLAVNGVVIIGTQSTRFSATGAVRGGNFAASATTTTGILINVSGRLLDDNSADGELKFTVGDRSITLAFSLTRATTAPPI